MRKKDLDAIKRRVEKIQGLNRVRWKQEECVSLIKDIWDLIRAVEAYREEIALISEEEGNG
jgi:hypothetical protein